MPNGKLSPCPRCPMAVSFANLSFPDSSSRLLGLLVDAATWVGLDARAFFRDAVVAHRLFVLLALLTLMLVPASAAWAEASISIDTSNLNYGWCAGYASERATTCAQDECQDGGNTCQQVLSCEDGWGAIVSPSDGTALVAVCGVGNAMTARQQAIAACVAALDELCWTNTTFGPNAQQESKDDNYNFDLVWYAQSLLQLENFTTSGSDGVMGPATRSALAKFNTAIGRSPETPLDEETLNRLIDGAEGIHRFAALLKANVVDPARPNLVNKIYSSATTTPTDISFTQELLQESDPDRRTALATLLSVNGNACSLPATDATLMGLPATSVSWAVDCAQASYTMIIPSGGSLVVMSGAPTPSQIAAPAQPSVPSQSDTAPSPEPAAPESAHEANDAPPVKGTAPADGSE